LTVVVGGYFGWRYRHDGMLHNDIALRLFRLSTTSDDRKLLLIGDSNIASMSCGGRFPGWRVLNLGIPGLRSQYLLAYIQAHAQEWPRFDAAVLWIGINDLRPGRMNPVDTAQNVAAILKDLAELTAQLAVVSQPPLPGGPDGLQAVGVNRDVAAMNMIVRRQTPPDLATVLTPFPSDAGVSMSEFFSHDGLHLNERGYDRVCTETGRWLSARG
jgi:lysophospholipase L1-like esterase